MKVLVRSIYHRVFPDLLNYLKRELQDCQTVLDLGCGKNSLIRLCAVPCSVGVELFRPYLEESKGKGIHSEYILADVREVEFKEKSFDAVLAIELIEHLTKDDGLRLIEKMKRWARKKVILTTPNWFLWQDGYDNNPLQVHRSGWNADELRNLGFQVYGINGWKFLRGYVGAPRFKPEFFWQRISKISQLVTYYFPKFAFQLLCVKTI